MIVESTEAVLDILRERNVTATFFVVGEIAAEYPDLVDRIAAEGHELGSHGHTHRPLFELTPGEFERELRLSREAIEAAAGVTPEGFRAPNFSVTDRTAWAFDVLCASDYEYDSSVFPLRTPMYGVSGAPRRPYMVDPTAPFTKDVPDGTGPQVDGLVELPLSAIGRRPRIPIAGGFYARVLPPQLFEAGIARLNGLGIPANVYFHPWEFNPNVITEEPSLPARFVSFYGVDGLATTLESILDRFDFGSVRRLRDDHLDDAGPAASFADH